MAELGPAAAETLRRLAAEDSSLTAAVAELAAAPLLLLAAAPLLLTAAGLAISTQSESLPASGKSSGSLVGGVMRSMTIGADAAAAGGGAAAGARRRGIAQPAHERFLGVLAAMLFPFLARDAGPPFRWTGEERWGILVPNPWRTNFQR